jgi:hypothetical protein
MPPADRSDLVAEAQRLVASYLQPARVGGRRSTGTCGVRRQSLFRGPY